ncbi:MAG: acyl-[acyl-carrier-protein] thioesterase [Muribaculaceae bacterium]|nr:acyl-[acyl-carrier-protein] thioesterase [Muribaculaceae bacterium]
MTLSQTFFLSAGEVNAEGQLSLPLLTAKIIDIATAHANSLGIGNPAMADSGCGWVLSRLTIEMLDYPRVNDTYTLTTWIEDWNRHFSTRCFRIDDENGTPLGYARSIWMVMNTQTRDNAGLSHLHLPEEAVAPLPCPIPRQARHTTIPAELIDRGYTFRYTDIDFYRHVNTVRYVNLLLNCFTLDEMDTHSIRRLELSFLHEGHYGHTVEIRRRIVPTPEAEPIPAKDKDIAAAEKIKANEEKIKADAENGKDDAEKCKDNYSERNEFLIHDPDLDRDLLYARIILLSP